MERRLVPDQASASVPRQTSRHDSASTPTSCSKPSEVPSSRSVSVTCPSSGQEPVAGPSTRGGPTSGLSFGPHTVARSPSVSKPAVRQRRSAVTRDEILANVSSDDDVPQQPTRARERKRPLSELIRNNQEAYNKFITKKIPKLMRILGVSSSSSDEN